MHQVWANMYTARCFGPDGGQRVQAVFPRPDLCGGVFCLAEALREHREVRVQEDFLVVERVQEPTLVRALAQLLNKLVV